MLPFLFSPIGRIALVAAGAGALFAVYMHIKSDIRSGIEGEIAGKTLERVNEAVRAGDRIHDPERVRELDEKYCRDCSKK